MNFRTSQWRPHVTLYLIVLLLFMQCDTLTATRFYFANSNTKHRFDYTELPFKLDRAVIIPVDIDGTTFDFALDTGSPVIAIIGREKTGALDLSLGSRVQLGGNGTGNSPVGHVVENVALSIGNLTLLNQSAIWIPWDQISYFNSEPEVFLDGIIGYDLFKRFVVELDFDRNQMVLIPALQYEYKGSGEIFELTMSSRKPYMMAEVTTLEGNKIPVKLHIDLGASANLTLLPEATPEIAVPKNTVRVPSWGISGKSHAHLGRIDELRLGAFHMDSVLTRFPIDGHRQTAGRHGVVGLGVLSRFKVIFDYERKRMILESRTESFESFIPNRSRIGFARYGKSYMVKSLWTGTDTLQNFLQVGDILHAINGYPASQLSRHQLDSCLRLEPGTQVNFCFIRDGTQHCEDITLVDPGI